jgi:hypothetical protein
MKNYKRSITTLFCFSFLFAASALNAQVDPDTVQKASVDKKNAAIEIRNRREVHLNVRLRQ